MQRQPIIGLDDLNHKVPLCLSTSPSLPSLPPSYSFAFLCVILLPSGIYVDNDEFCNPFESPFLGPYAVRLLSYRSVQPHFEWISISRRHAYR